MFNFVFFFCFNEFGIIFLLYEEVEGLILLEILSCFIIVFGKVKDFKDWSLELEVYFVMFFFVKEVMYKDFLDNEVIIFEYLVVCVLVNGDFMI